MTTASVNTNFTLIEYIWIDAYLGVRSKTKVIHQRGGITLKDLPDWNYDGSSTGQAPGTDSEVIIKPQAMYSDPFRGAPHLLVICDTYTPKGEPIPTNSRYPANKIFDKAPEEVPWFGIEQEYSLFKEGTPLGWPKSTARSFGGVTTQIGFPGPQGPYYCAAGADVSFGRDVVEEHLLLCLRAGLNISGINGEVMPGQWEFQVGPCVGIAAGDQMWVARYILHRVCEKYGVVATFEPKPIKGDWNGAGCHTNFSTKKMRETANSLEKIIIPMMDKLAARHRTHIASYGSGNHERLTGKHETSSMEKFSYGVANRGASVRIPNATALAKKGYFEDRRPASNMDPYIVTSLVFETCCILPLQKVDLVVDTTSSTASSVSADSTPAASPTNAIVKGSKPKTPKGGWGIFSFGRKSPR